MTLSNLLRADRLYLTTLIPEDAPTMASWFSDVGFLRTMGTNPARPRTSDEISTWIKDSTASPNDEMFCIRLNEGDEPIGYCALDGINWQHRNAGIALGLGRDYWQQGYGSEAAPLLITFAFHELNLCRLVATVFDYNTSSRALLEKLGFTHEGTHRQHLERDGQRWDMHLYGILRTEWNHL